jgi:hypothetical protein
MGVRSGLLYRRAGLASENEAFKTVNRYKFGAGPLHD